MQDKQCSQKDLFYTWPHPSFNIHVFKVLFVFAKFCTYVLQRFHFTRNQGLTANNVQYTEITWYIQVCNSSRQTSCCFYCKFISPQTSDSNSLTIYGRKERKKNKDKNQT